MSDAPRGNGEPSRRDFLRRALAASVGVAASEIEFRIARRDAALDPFDGRLLRGTPIVFDSLSVELGAFMGPGSGFRERIRPEAVNRTLKEGIDVRALIDHDTAKILARRSAGTLSLRKEADGLHSTIDPPDTSYARDIVTSVQRGDVSGMSFGFRVLEDEWHIEDGHDVREVIDMEVYEVSIVTFPAYEETDVEVGKRSLDAFRSMRAWKPSLAFRERKVRAGAR